VFISVPRIFSRIAENIRNKFVEMKLPTFHHEGIFAKVRESFGGCIRLLGTGSAPINIEVQKYLKEVFACPFLEGYGQT
jgi:long-subunit acyl-CoA synthetase (AMP-forming)